MFHQKFQARHMVNSNGYINENFFRTQMELKNESQFVLERVPLPYQDLSAEFNFTKTCHKISFGSIFYQRGTVLESSQPFDMDPVFVCIEHIFMEGNDAFLGVKMYKNTEFDENLCAFKCTDYENCIIPFSSIPYRLILPTRTHKNPIFFSFRNG